MPIHGELRLPVSDKPINFGLVRHIIPNKRGDKDDITLLTLKRSAAHR